MKLKIVGTYKKESINKRKFNLNLKGCVTTLLFVDLLDWSSLEPLEQLDHVWFKYGKAFKHMDFIEGHQYVFRAKLYKKKKGYEKDRLAWSLRNPHEFRLFKGKDFVSSLKC